MKFRVDPLWATAGLALAGVAVVVGVLGYERLSGPPLTLSAVYVSEAFPGQSFAIRAEAIRKPSEGCTNGVQVELRSVSNSIIRLPVPAREIDGDVTEYIVELPKETTPGNYGVKVRETFNCGGSPKVEETPWQRLVVR